MYDNDIIKLVLLVLHNISGILLCKRMGKKTAYILWAMGKKEYTHWSKKEREECQKEIERERQRDR